MLKILKASVERQWYGRPTWLFLLAPLAGVFALLAYFRRNRQIKIAQQPPVPVIVIGNITVGGTGKTPVIIALARELLAQGFKPGVIARGYGATFEGVIDVMPESRVEAVGDEPLLIRTSAGCCVAIGASRVDAADYLYCERGCDVILSDDGLQHYRLARSYECIVVDGRRLFGNGWRLPVGPLREGIHRLNLAQSVLINSTNQTQLGAVGTVNTASSNIDVTSPLPEAITLLQPKAYRFYLKPTVWRNVQTHKTMPLAELNLSMAVAVAGIGNPGRFFDTLRGLGFVGKTKIFDDHHPFSASDFTNYGNDTVLMTEKDATKCHGFAQPNWWALQVSVELPPEFLTDCIAHIQQHKSKQFPSQPSINSI